MNDLTLLTILLGILGLALIGLLWFIFKLERRVDELERTTKQLEGDLGDD